MCKSLIHSSLYGALRFVWIMEGKYRVSTECLPLSLVLLSFLVVLCSLASLLSVSSLSSIPFIHTKLLLRVTAEDRCVHVTYST